MPNQVLALRAACRTYPARDLLDAVIVALRPTVTDDRERESLAALVVAWLTDDDPAAESPPLSDHIVKRIRQELRSRAH